MDTCKHDWHFVGETTRLRCERCKQEAGPWTTEQLVVPTSQLYTLSNLKPSHNITLSNAEGEVGRLDFNGPQLVFIGNADESAKVFLDWVAHYFDQRLKDERQAELDACCELLEGMHAATTGSHNYYLHAAVELKRLRKGTP